MTATLTPQRLLAYLIGGFGVLALALAALGLYGLISYAVTERARRSASAWRSARDKADVMRLFVADGMKLRAGGRRPRLARARSPSRR